MRGWWESMWTDLCVIPMSSSYSSMDIGSVSPVYFLIACETISVKYTLLSGSKRMLPNFPMLFLRSTRSLSKKIVPQPFGLQSICVKQLTKSNALSASSSFSWWESHCPEKLNISVFDNSGQCSRQPQLIRVPIAVAFLCVHHIYHAVTCY